MSLNIPETDKKRIVIVGAGFAGLQLARKLAGGQFQVVLFDRNNYHQFQPLIYQVATAGLEPSSVSFPLRKIFQGNNQVLVRNVKVQSIHTDSNEIKTKAGTLTYDYLILATGASSNFFGLENLSERSYPMKSVGEALNLRNHLLQNFEALVTEDDPEKMQSKLSFVIVGGGATGVELSGALAEMKKFILPKDYPDLDFSNMKIYLIEASDKVLGTMSAKSSATAFEYLKKMDVAVMLNTHVTDFDGSQVFLKDGRSIKAINVIWTAGIKGVFPEGVNPEVIGKGNRIEVDEFNQVKGSSNIFAIGDVARIKVENYPEGHPMVAQVAIQQARNLAKNLKNLSAGKKSKPFVYHDKGSMATIGRNRAVAEINGVFLRGLVAWVVWMFVHLMAIVGVKNRLLIFINWFWNYVTYDQSLRLIIRPSKFVK
jgi:NADH dehydrogenase